MRPDKPAPCAILLCFHFAPSSAVAARRVGAFAQSIAANGLEVLVTSEFGGSLSRDLPAALVPIRITESPRPLIDLMVSGKRMLSAPWRRLRGHPDGPRPQAETVAALSRRFSDWVIGLLHTIDEHKRWSVRASLATLRAAQGREVRFVLGSGPPFSRDPLLGGAGIPTALSIHLQSSMERRIVVQAHAVCAASPGIAAGLRARYPTHAGKIQVILNGFDGEPAPRLSDTGHRLNILFAGSLYGSRDPFPFLDAVETMLAASPVDSARIRIRFIGDCEAYRGVRLASWAAGKRIGSVLELLPQMPTAGLRDYVEEATVLLNIAQNQPLQIPAKTFEHLASGREVLAICEPDSDTGRLLAGIAGAWCVDSAAPAAMVAVLADLYHRHAVLGMASAPSLENVRAYSRNIQDEHFRRLLDSVI